MINRMLTSIKCALYLYGKTWQNNHIFPIFFAFAKDVNQFEFVDFFNKFMAFRLPKKPENKKNVVTNTCSLTNYQRYAEPCVLVLFRLLTIA